MAGTFIEGWEEGIDDWTLEFGAATDVEPTAAEAFGCTHSLLNDIDAIGTGNETFRYQVGLPGSGSQDTTYWLSCAVYVPTGFTAALGDGNSVYLPSFAFDDSGTFVVILAGLRNDTGTLYAQFSGTGTYSAAVTEGSWHFLELSAEVDSATEDVTSSMYWNNALVDSDTLSVGLGDGATITGLYVGSNGIDGGEPFYIDTLEWDQTGRIGPVAGVDEEPCPAGPGARFYQNPLWRFVVTTLDGEVLTFLDHLAMDRTVTYLLGAPAQTSGRVPSDNPEINIVADDGYPFLAEGNRLMFGFRREGGNPPWVIRFAGIVMQVEDRADADQESVAYSHYTAWDPWQYLMNRPVMNQDGDLPGPDGISWTATPSSEVAAQILRNTIINEGTVYIDAGASYGGTGFYTGTIESTLPIDINFEQGTTVGQAWQELMATNTLDILLLPIYDPLNRPGTCVQFNAYAQAGSVIDEAIFAWDKPSRSLIAISHQYDGSQRANKVQFGAGPGGMDGYTTTEIDAASVAKYGAYWYTRFFPGQQDQTAVQSFAEFTLELLKNGKQTVVSSPAPERSPLVFQEFYLGDRVPVYASRNLREPIPAPQDGTQEREFYQRVYGIPLTLTDDGVEEIREMLMSVTQA